MALLVTFVAIDKSNPSETPRAAARNTLFVAINKSNPPEAKKEKESPRPAQSIPFIFRQTRMFLLTKIYLLR